MPKIAAKPAAIAAHALHWLCSYTKRRSNLGSSRPVPKPRFQDSGGGGKSFRKNFERQFHARFSPTPLTPLVGVTCIGNSAER
jgi:hypothetical protein